MGKGGDEKHIPFEKREIDSGGGAHGGPDFDGNGASSYRDNEPQSARPSSARAPEPGSARPSSAKRD